MHVRCKSADGLPEKTCCNDEPDQKDNAEDPNNRSSAPMHITPGWRPKGCPGARKRKLNVQVGIVAVGGAVPATQGVGFGGVEHFFELSQG